MDYPPTNLLFLSKQDVDALITPEDVFAAVESVFRADGMGKVISPVKELMPAGDGGALFAMPGLLGDAGVAGVKWTNFCPNQPQGLPVCWGHVLVLSSTETGQPFAVMDATTITNQRTAGGHTVAAAKYLANPGARTMGVLGCGAQGRSAIRSFDRLFDLSRILVHTRSREKFEAFRAQAQDGLRARLDYAPTPKALAEQSEILITATTSHTPVIRAEWVPQGAFVGGVYSFYDLDSALSAQADKWVLGHRRSDGDEILDNPDFAGKLSAGDVYGTLGEIVCGKLPGRESPDERIVFTHMGMGALDIAIGNRIVEKARSLGAGQTLRLI